MFTSEKDQPPIWNLIVPETIEYQFSVETNFKIESFDNEANLEISPEDEIIKRFNDNFFANDNLLMSAPMQSKFNEHQRADRRRFDKVKQLLEKDEMEVDEIEAEEDQKEEEDDDFELDDVNKHPCMQILLKVIDTLNDKFGSELKDDKMPGWMERLFNDYSSDIMEKPNINPSAKLFILKLIINRPNVFQPYANHWFSHLADYVVSKDTGGKGLHYFLRDVCTILINFSDSIDLENDSNKQKCNEILNCLIKYAADKRKLIFTHNISIIGKLMEKWKQCITELNEVMLGKMLNAKESEIQNSDLWIMAGIQIVALACKIGIQSNLLNHLIKQLEHRKRSIIFSASEVIGVLLSNQIELLEDASTKVQQIFSGEAKQDLFVSIVQKISKYQGLFAIEKPILQKLLTYLKPFSATFRACILQSLKS